MTDDVTEPDTAPDTGPTTRRRVLQTIFERHPGIGQADVLRLMGDVGLHPSGTDMASDLAALGLGFGPDGGLARTGPADPAPPAGDGGEVPATADASDPGADGPAVDVSAATAGHRQFWAESGGGGERMFGQIPARIALIGGVAVLVVLIVVAIVLSSGGGGKDKSGSTTTTSDDLSNVTVAGGTPASTAPVVTAPIGPGGDVKLLAKSDAIDPFDTDTADGLGQLGTTGAWRVLSGQWSVIGGEARVAATPGGTNGQASLALAPKASADVRAQVSLPKLILNEGLVFRATDERNYWIFVASPQYSTFTLAHVVDGKRNIVANSGLTTTKKHAATIGVNAQGATIEVLVNGAVVKTVTDPDTTRGTGFGLGALPGATVASFDQFIYRVGA